MTEENKTYAKLVSIACGNIDNNDPSCEIINGADFTKKVNGGKILIIIVICLMCRVAKCNCPIDLKTAYI